MNILTWYNNAQTKEDNVYTQAIESNEKYDVRQKRLIRQRYAVMLYTAVMAVCSTYIGWRDLPPNMQRVTEIPTTYVLCFATTLFCLSVKFVLDAQLKTFAALKYLSEQQNRLSN